MEKRKGATESKDIAIEELMRGCEAMAELRHLLQARGFKDQWSAAAALLLDDLFSSFSMALSSLQLEGKPQFMLNCCKDLNYQAKRRSCNGSMAAEGVQQQQENADKFRCNTWFSEKIKEEEAMSSACQAVTPGEEEERRVVEAPEMDDMVLEYLMMGPLEFNGLLWS